MISIEECRKIDPRLETMTDEQVTKIRDMLYQLGQLAFDRWYKKGGSKLQCGVVGHTNDDMQL